LQIGDTDILTELGSLDDNESDVILETTNCSTGGDDNECCLSNNSVDNPEKDWAITVRILCAKNVPDWTSSSGEGNRWTVAIVSGSSNQTWLTAKYPGAALVSTTSDIVWEEGPCVYIDGSLRNGGDGLINCSPLVLELHQIQNPSGGFPGEGAAQSKLSSGFAQSPVIPIHCVRKESAMNSNPSKTDLTQAGFSGSAQV
jgi:hypothetical protein